VHPPSHLDPPAVDLAEAGNLTRSWLAHWTTAPHRPVVIDADGLAAGSRILICADATTDLIIDPRRRRRDRGAR